MSNSAKDPQTKTPQARKPAVKPKKKPASKKPNARKRPAQRLADARVRMYSELIFECAEGVFGSRGYDGATMNDIADEAGVSLKTLYATYENKQDLYDQIMRRRAGGFVEAMQAASADIEDPLVRIEKLVEAYVAYLYEHEDWLRIHLHSRRAWAFRPSDDEVAVSWSAVLETYSRAIREGMDTGQIYSGDPEELTVLMQSIMQLQMARAIEQERREPEQLATAMLTHIRRLLCPKP